MLWLISLKWTDKSFKHLLSSIWMTCPHSLNTYMALSKAFSCFCPLKVNAVISQVHALFIYSIYMYTGPPLWQAAWPAYVIKCRSKVPLVWGKLADVIMQSRRLSPHFEFVESIKTTVVDEVRRSRWYFSWVFYCTALSVQCLSTNCHVWKTFAVRFHVTSQVTNQTGCVKEEEKHLSSPSEALMKSFCRRHVFEWKPCNSNSLPQLSNLLFLLYKVKTSYAANSVLYLMNPSRVTFRQRLGSRCKSQDFPETENTNVTNDHNYGSLFRCLKCTFSHF